MGRIRRRLRSIFGRSGDSRDPVDLDNSKHSSHAAPGNVLFAGAAASTGLSTQSIALLRDLPGQPGNPVGVTAGPSESVAHGLFLLHPSPEEAHNNRQFSVDIVAIHGLNGKAHDTWKDGLTGALWLEDFLPQALPDARIMTFGYDSSLFLSTSKGRVEDFARDLLNRLWTVRQSSEAKKRPLVFVAHSLGGIVVKKAIILAHENDHQYGQILRSTTGIVFMGTPHEGASIVNWTSFLRYSIQLTSGNLFIRTDLIKQLSMNSDILLDISKSFLPRSKDFQIMSFIETRCEPPLTVLVVPQESARLGLANEMIFPVNTHHRNICRYPSKEDQTYILVKHSIESIVTGQIRDPESGRDMPIVSEITKACTYCNGTSGNWSDEGVDTTKYETYPLTNFDPASAKINHQKQCEVDVNDISAASKKKDDMSVELADVNDCNNHVHLRISGLKRKISASQRGWTNTRDTRVWKIPGKIKIRELPDFLKMTTQAQDFVIPQNFRFKDRHSPISTNWTDCFTSCVRVTSENSCYKSSIGYKINQDETIASFFSKIFPTKMEAKLQKRPEWMQSSVGSSHFVSIDSGCNSSMHVSFMRSMRVPNNETTYSPPRGLGTFPLFSTQNYKERLPTEVASQGGLFLPMFENEAMYIAFECPKKTKFAIRPFLGGINGISGDSLLDLPPHSGTVSSQSPASHRKQDYIVAPKQKRLDGIATSPGIVKQFVAMKPRLEAKESSQSRTLGSLNGVKDIVQSQNDLQLDKSTIEWQMTGTDIIRGVQLQIIPEFVVNRMFAGDMKDACPPALGEPLVSYGPVPDTVKIYDVLKTPKELHVASDSFIYLKDMMAMREQARDKTVADLPAEAWTSSPVLDLEVIYDELSVKFVSITAEGSNEDPILFKVTLDDNLEDVQAAAQEIFGMPNAELQIQGLPANNSNLSVPVKNWEQVAFLTDSTNLIGEPKGRSSQYIQDDSYMLILAPRKHEYYCTVNFGHAAKARFSELKGPIILAMSKNSDVAELERVIQQITMLPTAGLCFTSPEHGFLDPSYKIFRDATVHKVSLMPSFVLDEVITVFVKTLTGKTLTLRLDPEHTFLMCKERIEAMEGIPIDQMRLIYEGKQPQDYHTISQFGIIDRSTMHLILRLRGGGSCPTRVRIDGVVIFKGHVSHVGELKMKILHTLGISPHLQNYELPDDEILTERGLTLDLHVRAPEPVTMSIGPGGTITQKIHPDTSNPRIWDVANSKILYIHLVNSGEFEAITGFLPHQPLIPQNEVSSPRSAYNNALEQHPVQNESLSTDKAFDHVVTMLNPVQDGGSQPKEDRQFSKGEYMAWSKSECLPDFSLMAPKNNLVLLDPDQTVPWFDVYKA